MHCDIAMSVLAIAAAVYLVTFTPSCSCVTCIIYLLGLARQVACTDVLYLCTGSFQFSHCAGIAFINKCEGAHVDYISKV
jgi:hypothetical protein